MKFINIAFLIGIFLLSYCFVPANDSLAWQRINQNIPGYDNFTDIYVSGKTIAISGMLGIYVSNDLGNTFTSVNSLNSKYAVALPDSITILCAGSNGTVAFSSDAGISWKEEKIGTDKRFKAVAFPSLDIAYAAGESFGDTTGYFFKYSSSSETKWKKVDINNMVVTIEGMFFFDDSCGYICGNGDFIWHTTDGAKSWIKDDIPEINQCLYDIFFVEKNLGWAVGSGGDILHWDGSAWSDQESGTSADIHSVYFLTNQTGWAVGDQGLILYTEDGGKTWVRQAGGLTGSRLKSVFALEKDLVFICGYNHEFLSYKLYTCNTDKPEYEEFTAYFSNGRIHLKSHSGFISNFKLFDILGRRIISVSNSDLCSVDAENYSSGLYFWTADIEGRNYSGKIFIE